MTTWAVARARGDGLTPSLPDFARGSCCFPPVFSLCGAKGFMLSQARLIQGRQRGTQHLASAFVSERPLQRPC